MDSGDIPTDIPTEATATMPGPSVASLINDTIETLPDGDHNYTLILLHDCLSCNTDFKEELEAALHPLSRAKVLPGAKFLFPNALYDVGGDPYSRTWFELSELSDYDNFAMNEEDWSELADAASNLYDLVLEECLLVGPENVFVGGYGMGAAVVFAMLLMGELALGGVIGVSGWFPFIDDVKRVTAGRRTRIQSEEAAEMDAETAQPATDPAAAAADTATNKRKAAALEAAEESTAKKRKVEYPPQGARIWLTRVTAFLRKLVKPQELAMVDTPVTTPIILCHNEGDPIVSVRQAKETEQAFRNLGFRVYLKRRDEDHHDLDFETLELILQEILDRDIGGPDIRGQIMLSFSNNKVERQGVPENATHAQVSAMDPKNSEADPQDATLGDQFGDLLLAYMESLSSPSP